VINKIHTLNNPADMLTKPLSIARFKHGLDLISIRSIQLPFEAPPYWALLFEALLWFFRILKIFDSRRKLLGI